MTDELFFKASHLRADIKAHESTINKLYDFKNKEKYPKVLLKTPSDSTMEYIINEEELYEIICLLASKHEIILRELVKEYENM